MQRMSKEEKLILEESNKRFKSKVVKEETLKQEVEHKFPRDQGT